MKSARSIKALHIIDSFGMGGAETWLMEMLRFWSTTGAVRTDFLLTSGNRGLFDTLRTFDGGVYRPVVGVLHRASGLVHQTALLSPAIAGDAADALLRFFSKSVNSAL